MSRIRAALKVLTTPEVIVVAKGFQFSTYSNASTQQSKDEIIIHIGGNNSGDQIQAGGRIYRGPGR